MHIDEKHLNILMVSSNELYFNVKENSNPAPPVILT